MTWAEIKQFIDEGGSVGQHTSSHLHMPLNSSSEIKKDILDSHKSWIKNIGYIPELFAYPYGESSNKVISILKEFEISHAFGQHSGVVAILTICTICLGFLSMKNLGKKIDLNLQLMHIH